MSVPDARSYVNSLPALLEEEKRHLKHLLNTGKIIPAAMIDSTIEDLRKIIRDNSLQNGTGNLFSPSILLIN